MSSTPVEALKALLLDYGCEPKWVSGIRSTTAAPFSDIRGVKWQQVYDPSAYETGYASELGEYEETVSAVVVRVRESQEQAPMTDKIMQEVLDTDE
jgi:hypothetical protein